VIHFANKAIYGAAPATNHVPAGVHLDTADATTVNGWAVDLNMLNTPVFVSMDIDGVPAASSFASEPRPDLATLLPTTDHGFSFTVPTTLSPGPHALNVYLNKGVTGEIVWLGQRVI